jgi:hypothetical protein
MTMLTLDAPRDRIAAGPATGTDVDNAGPEPVGLGHGERHGLSAESVMRLPHDSRCGQPANTRPVARWVVQAVAALLLVAMSAGCGVEEPGTASRTGSDRVLQHVRVDVERTGGFGGLVTRGSADTDSLPAEESRELTRLVMDLDVEALRKAPSPTRTIPDAYEYDIVISMDGEQVTVHAQDPDLPGQLRPLLRFVLQRK